MDGVLVDSTTVHMEAWRVYLDRHGITLPDLGERMLGKHNDDIVRDFFGEPDMTQEDVVSHGARKEELYRELMADELMNSLVPGVIPFLARHRKVPMALASNAEIGNIDFVLDGAGIRHFFRVVISGNQVSRPKPHPDIYLAAAEKLGTEPQGCVVFEDSETGVQAARAAGMYIVALTTTRETFADVDLGIRSFEDPELDRWLSELPTQR